MKRLIAIALCLVFTFSLFGCKAKADSSNYEERFNIIRYSDGMKVITDETTGVQYVFKNEGFGAGLTILIDADGKPLLAEGWERDA